MPVSVQNSDVLDVAADALIYSTNVLFNCSGGVGSCLVARYGPQVQQDLHGILQRLGTRFAGRGDVEEFVSAGLPYMAVFHTVPSNGFYETSEEIVAGVLRKALEGCVARPEVRTAVFPALATGYGRVGVRGLSADRFRDQRRRGIRVTRTDHAGDCRSLRVQPRP